MIKAADLFCGAGGTSIGAFQTGEVEIAFALNHWKTAIQTHEANFPQTKHLPSALKWTHPSECPKINLLFASPECTHHSKARGGRPTSNQQRSGAWEIMPWIEYHRPSVIVVENVIEFEDWGPVGDNGKPLQSLRGHFFDAWLSAIRSAGYRVEYQRLNAADYGAATNRIRLFVVAKKGRRFFHWPDPTHTKNAAPQLPGFEQQNWRGAIEIIDWSIPVPSVFGRKRPLADKTLARIEAGLRRHVGPYVVSVNHGDSGGIRTYEIKKPLGTQTQANGKGIAVPMIVQFDNQSNESVPLDSNQPIRTVTTKNGQAIAVPLVMAPQSGGGVKDVSEPVPTITTMAGSQVIVPWLTSFYGTHQSSDGKRPVPTVTTKDRHALTVAQLIGQLPAAQTEAEKQLLNTMKELGVVDIGFRMLANHELANAQGFPMDYKFCGTKKDVTKQIGNSVSPPVARAITEALLA